jgi:hypothetical protein
MTVETKPAKLPLPEVLTAEDIADMLAEAAEVDAYFQMGFPRRSRASFRRRVG